MWDKKYQERLDKNRALALAGGGAARIEKQHKKGKLTARERLEILFDEGKYTEIGAFAESRIDDFGADKKRAPGDGVVTGYGRINGKLAFAAAEDFTVFGGTVGEVHAKKICDAFDKAIDMRAPMIMLLDSGGARVEEGVCSLAGYAGLFLRNTKASGLIPQIAVIMGPCAGGACYSPALCDFIFMVENTSCMFITGPQVVMTATREKISAQELGGAALHSKKSGNAHFVYPDDKSCLKGVRKLLTYLPQSCDDKCPKFASEEPRSNENLRKTVPDNQRKGYDVRGVINAVADHDSFFEVQKDFAKNAVIGFARTGGAVTAYVANQPDYMCGSLDVDASDKVARFIRFCDAFGIPIISFVDVPGYLPGKEQEQAGIIRHGAKMLFAYSEAVVPKITVILRKAYGGAYIAMNSKEMGADVVYAWPIAEIAVMGEEGAVQIIFSKQIEAAKYADEERDRLVKEYKDLFMNPYYAAKRGLVDEVIYPEETRAKVLAALEMLKTKKTSQTPKKHGNIPL